MRVIINHRDRAIIAFDQGRAALHPVTTVVISDSAEFAHGYTMDVSAQHGVHMIAFRVMRHSGFEFADETHGVLHSSLGIRAERPEAQAETTPDEVNKWIERKEKLVAEVTRKREPLHPSAAGNHHVEFVTMNNQDPLA